MFDTNIQAWDHIILFNEGPFNDGPFCERVLLEQIIKEE